MTLATMATNVATGDNMTGHVVTAVTLAKSLSVEGLRYTDTPWDMRGLVTKFRHLNRPNRVAACAKWMSR